MLLLSDGGAGGCVSGGGESSRGEYDVTGVSLLRASLISFSACSSSLCIRSRASFIRFGCCEMVRRCCLGATAGFATGLHPTLAMNDRRIPCWQLLHVNAFDAVRCSAMMPSK